MMSVGVNDGIKKLVFDPDVIRKTWKKEGMNMSLLTTQHCLAFTQTILRLR